MNRSQPFVVAGVLGASGVGLGAFGAHALQERLVQAGYLDVWETAVSYQLWHAIALLAVAVWMRTGQAPGLGHALVHVWTAGVVVFSSTLYAICLGGPKWLGAVTPVGGTLLIAGWVLVAIAGLKTPSGVKIKSNPDN